MTELCSIYKRNGADKWEGLTKYYPPERGTAMDIYLGGGNVKATHSSNPHKALVWGTTAIGQEVQTVLLPDGGRKTTLDFATSDGTIYRFYHASR